MTTRQNDPETIREEGVNVLLAQSLRERGFSARAERRSRSGAPDVRVELRSGDLVLLECKWEGNETLLESQLDERLTAFPEALGLVGVLYPDRLRHAENTQAELEAAAYLRWWLHGSRGAKTNDRRIRSGSVSELADYLRTLPLRLEGVDRVTAAANAVGYALEQAAKQVTKHARISRRIADIIASTTTGSFKSRRWGLRARRWGMSKAMMLCPRRNCASSASRSNCSSLLPLGRPDMERDLLESGRYAAAANRAPASRDISRSSERQRQSAGFSP